MTPVYSRAARRRRVWRACTPARSEVTSCQIAVSVSMVTDTVASGALAAVVPESWDPASPKAAGRPVSGKRPATGGLGASPWTCAASWCPGRRPPLIVADWGYEADAEFRRELHERGLNADLAQAPRTTITRDWTGRPPVSTLAKLVTPPARAQPGASRGEKAPASAAASPQRNKTARRTRPQEHEPRRRRPGLPRPRPSRSLADSRGARTGQVLAAQPARPTTETKPGALRTRQPRGQDRPRPARLTPPRHPRLRRLLFQRHVGDVPGPTTETRTPGRSQASAQAPSSLPLGSVKWKRRPPGNSYGPLTTSPPASRTAATVWSRSVE